MVTPNTLEAEKHKEVAASTRWPKAESTQPPVPVAMNFLERKQAPTLPELRSQLIKLEDSIIFAMIERACYKQNANIYRHGAFPLPSDDQPPIMCSPTKAGDKKEAKEDHKPPSFLEYMLHETEVICAKVRRYMSPDEYPFSRPSSLPKPILPHVDFPALLHPNTVNLNPQLLDTYINTIVPMICKPGDDSNYGSAVTRDVTILQLLSQRIHYGKFVAEAKWLDPECQEQYRKMIKQGDRKGIYDLLTNMEVEKRLLKRVDRKAAVYGQDITDDQGGQQWTKLPQEGKIDQTLVEKIFEEIIIPLTKQVEVDYLMQRA